MAKRTVFRQYQRLPGIDRDECIYCGEPAEQIDHVLPVRYSNWQRVLTDEERDQLYTVPSCAECNNLAQARPFPSLLAKRDFIRARLRRKYGIGDQVEDHGWWSDAELRELGPNLRSYVVGEQARYRLVVLRLIHEGIPTRYLTAAAVDAWRTSED